MIQNETQDGGARRDAAPQDDPIAMESLISNCCSHHEIRKWGATLSWGRPLPVGGFLLAPHGGDSLEGDTAHERDAHTEASEGERSVHAQLDTASIQSHGEDGEDRADCEANNARTIEGDLGVGGVGLVGVHVEVLSVGRSSFDNPYIRGLMPFCIYELPPSQILHACVENMNCLFPSSLMPACLNIDLVERKNEQERI